MMDTFTPSSLQAAFGSTPKMNSLDPYRIDSSESKEKENNAFENVRFLTMNSSFVTSFKTGYTLPDSNRNEVYSKSNMRPFKWKVKAGCDYLKRRMKECPYGKNPRMKVGQQTSNNADSTDNQDQIAYRLRTASLNSGTRPRLGLPLKRNKYDDAPTTSSLQRSRSMEDLSNLDETESLSSAPDKSKDIDTVSKGIQEMQVADST